VQSSEGREEIISACKATGQVLLAEDGRAVPGQSQTAMNIPITNLIDKRKEKRENCCVLYSKELNEDWPFACTGYFPPV